MLNGLDPIMIFLLKKRVALPDGDSEIPILPTVGELVPLAPIPIYLSQKLTGLVIQTEEKSLEVQTDTNSPTDGSEAKVQQRAIASTITINMVCKRTAIGAATIAALADLVFPLVASKEYGITYLHGAVTVFNGLLNSFSINQEANNDLYSLSMSLIKQPPASVKAVAQVPKKDTIDISTPIINSSQVTG